MELYNEIMNKDLLVRRINITANHVVNEEKVKNEKTFEQLDLFTNYKMIEKDKIKEEKEKNLQQAVINIKNKYGKNAVLKGMNYEEGGTTIERNRQIGGHKE